MKRVSQTNQFLRDIGRMRKRGKDLNKLKEVVVLLAEGIPLPAKHRDHPLGGPWQTSRDCHIESDWILIYTMEQEVLRLERTGTHSDLFSQ
ncbi:MAG TPA: type II toxin-antitoxin system YafQ family toxin [Candidatus Hydrogenedentes bacterium]|nr:type II toxin-antitoxin system YafQ family toxin [Candidatus Hydrogenedentota bacterium]